ncbi:hypothetical protein [Candidatus Poriferisodalis sp.]|uniref:hypothetical protein n=1 Tax=Candidatus Poriferisodalis sp. TaxID=3101277 RepID=UPI003B01A2CD
MIVAVIVISLVIGFVVAAGVVGSQAQRLGRQRREPVWRLAEAAEFVAELVPFDIAASLSASELEALLRAHLNQLQFGPAAAPDEADGADADAEGAMGTSVTEDRSSAAELYRSVRRDGFEVSLEQVHAVASAHLEYLRLIGALAVVDPGGS